MKKIAVVFLFLFFPYFVSSQIYSGCDDVPDEALGGKNCVETTECTGIYTSNTYHLLMSDVSSNGTCFEMNADNVELNLNGHTVLYAQTGPGIGVSLSKWGRKSGISIHDGQIHGGYNNSNVVSCPDGARYNIEIYNINASCGGLDTSGITLANNIVNVSIHDVNITLNGTKVNPCSHYGGHMAGIGLTNPSGVIEVYNNRLIGRGMLGITMSSCQNEFIEPARIFNNYVSIWSPVRDGYAIQINGNHNSCSGGTLIYNNVIDQMNGRGIAVMGNDLDTDHGPGNVEVFNNNITVREGWDCEYDGSGTAAGVRVRFGAHDNYFHHNYIRGFAGTGVANGSHPTKDGSKTIGFYLGAAKPYGKNNRYEHNIIEVSTNNASFPATGIYLADINSVESAYSMYFANNTVISNNIGITNNGFDGQSNNVLFNGTTLVKGDNPLDFFPVMLGGYHVGAINLSFLDTKGVGTSIHEIGFNTDYNDGDYGVERIYEDLFFKWTLIVDVTDVSGESIVAAEVTIKDKFGEVVSEGQTNSQGKFESILIERTYNDSAEIGQYPDYFESTPHDVSIAFNGETKSELVFMNSTKNISFVFLQSNCTLPYDLEPCGNISISELGNAISAWFENNLEMGTLMRIIKVWKG